MDIVRMRAGLGNQMFCYALYLELLYRGRDVGIDMGFYSKYPDWPDPYMLEYVFPEISLSPIDESIFNSINERYKKDISEPKRKEYLDSHPEERIMWGEDKEDVGCFREDLFNTKNCAFVGLWYSEKYFCHVKDQIRKDFSFRKGEDKLSEIADNMHKKTCISLNIRLGRAYSYVDTTTPNGNKVANIVRDGYYQRAIEEMKKRVGQDVIWYVFSDASEVLSGKKNEHSEVLRFRVKDISVEPGVKNYLESVDILKDELKELNTVYITKDMFDAYNDWYDLYLMSQANHNIIANSSFGWWGAWLNNNPDKIICAPDSFFSSSKCSDIYPEGWLRL